MDVKKRRAQFNAERATQLARASGTRAEMGEGPGERFTYFHDDQELTLVAGPQEGRDCDLALPYGLHARQDRRLRLVIPRQQSGATLLRVPWLRMGLVEVWTFEDGNEPQKEKLSSPAATLDQFACWIDDSKPKDEVREEEFRKASVPFHLGKRAKLVAPLVDRIAERGDLDPGHRKDYRAWHYCGQKVLEISGMQGGLRVRAGILNEEGGQTWEVTDVLTNPEVTLILGKLEDGIRARTEPSSKYSNPDEHWLQSVLGRQPRAVGIEGRALREVPAWRRAGAYEPAPRKGAWGRGYMDLLGVDAHGTIQIVETKLAANDDPLFVLQGIDYLAYCEAYRRPITRRLDVRAKAPMAIRYVVGTHGRKKATINRFAAATRDALSDAVRFSFLGLTNWKREPSEGRPFKETPVEDKA